MNCQFCNKFFSDKSNLVKHQQRTKKCLKIQKDQNISTIKIRLFKCKFCPKELSSQQSLNYHLNICKSKPNTIKDDKTDDIDILIDDADSPSNFSELIEINDDVLVENINADIINDLNKSKSIIKQLQTELKKAKNEINNKHSNNIVNNYNIVNNTNITINMNFLDFMTAENIKEIFDKHYTGKIFLGAEKSLAVFMVEKFLLGKDKPIYLCPDKSRYNFTYFNDDEIMDDLNAKILITLSKIYGADAIYNAYMDNKKNIENVENIDEIYNKLKNLDHNNKDYLNELRILLPKNLKDREIQNKIHEIKLNEDEKFRLLEEDENKKLKMEKQLLENIDLSVYENKIRDGLLEEFIKLYLYTGELKCPKNFSQKDIHTFKKYIYKWSQISI